MKNLVKDLLRPFLSQWLINTFWHLPVAVLANLNYGFPSKKLIVIGVTGTDGKTTTVNMIYQILKGDGKKVSMVSTINAVIGGKKYDTGFHVTSPDPFMVQKFIVQALKNGDEYIVLEVTSHGLDQHRYWGVKFDIGVITNITHEHLDYHKSFENYFKAKAQLIINSKLSIINADEKHFEKLAKLAKGQVVSFGLHKNANFSPIKFPIKLKIHGEYNFMNALAAAATGINLGVDSKIVKSALSDFKNLVGRMEEIENNLGIKIFIDFAHTPNALEYALTTLRKITKGKLISVFGCAGERDVQKRPLMGEISASLADCTVITAEDPRGMIDQINKQIMDGAKKAGGILMEQNLEDKNVFISEGKKLCFIENDREKAIILAVNILAKKGDTIGIFGKGHERSMNLDGKREIAWSDQKAVLRALENG